MIEKVKYYCALCGDYFVDIKNHHYEKHGHDFKDYNVETQTTTWNLPSLSNGVKFTGVPNN
jgi:hypothetical protein